MTCIITHWLITWYCFVGFHPVINKVWSYQIMFPDLMTSDRSSLLLQLTWGVPGRPHPVCSGPQSASFFHRAARQMQRNLGRGWMIPESWGYWLSTAFSSSDKNTATMSKVMSMPGENNLPLLLCGYYVFLLLYMVLQQELSLPHLSLLCPMLESLMAW